MHGGARELEGSARKLREGGHRRRTAAPREGHKRDSMDVDRPPISRRGISLGGLANGSVQTARVRRAVMTAALVGHVFPPRPSFALDEPDRPTLLTAVALCHRRPRTFSWCCL